MNDEQQDRELLAAVRDFALNHPEPVIAKFKASLRDWGNEYVPVDPVYLPAADNLGDAIATSHPQTRALLALLEKQKSRLFWEQSYTQQDGVVSDAMLANYGFVEILGSQGPFVSERIRAGVSIYGPGIVYPRHRHQAEEIYIVLAGSAEFKVGDADGIERSANEVIFVSSNTTHGFRSGADALVIFYLWQAGDLRQISNFG